MTTLREQVAAKIAPVLSPIAGPKPAGMDPSYDLEFERLKTEIDKLSSIEAREPSWRDVRDVGVELLTRRAKDLRVAGWVGAAHVKLGGWSGLVEALLLYDGLARGFWEGMFPDEKRMRARVSAFSWLAELISKHLAPADVSLTDGDAIRASNDVLRELDGFLAEKFGDAYAGAGPLRRLLREKLAAIPQPVAAAPSTPAAQPPPQNLSASPTQAESNDRANAPVPEGLSSAAPSGEVDGAVQESSQALLRASAAIRAADPARAHAYRLQRWGAWATLEDPPPADGGRTRIRPPPEAFARRLTALRDSQKWLELLLSAEEATGRFLFWLDMHRWVSVAMDRLGPTFLPARGVVGREVVAFAVRFPSVPSLAFSNGTPFADAGTKTWLEEEIRRHSGEGASAARAAASAEDEDVGKRFAEAEELVSAGKVAEGLALAAALMARGADGRTRFRAGIALGNMALKGSRPEVARAILEHLASEADRRDLDVWEPALCAALYTSLLTAVRDSPRSKAPLAAPAAPKAASREQDIFDKLCRLDPAAALKFASG